MIESIRKSYIKDRVTKLDPDFLQFEEEMACKEDIERLADLVCHKQKSLRKLENSHNSCILYATGLTDEFDFVKARCDTFGGSPPDIDIDFDTLDRTKAINWVVEHWGREQVASIITHGRFKPKSATKDWFRVTEGDQDLMREILRKIPKQVHGFEATLADVVEGNTEKHYEPHPELQTDPKYADWHRAAYKLEGMVNKFGIHAAGIVISNDPIWDVMPIWMKKDKELMPDGKKQEITKWITQFDMTEVEALGMIKFDFLGIDNLSVLKECVKLIETRHGITLDMSSIPDRDKKAYALLHQGLLTGIFQMEASATARELIQGVKPTNISELSDISALNRPGPMDSGLHLQYIENKNHGYDTRTLPPPLANQLKQTYWTLVYQEQCMFIASNLAGFTLRRADDLRRAIGKKKAKLMAEFEDEFISGLINIAKMTKIEAEVLWEEMKKFGAYGFNKSHSICYSVVTYWCAYLKANYPLEFFAALMSVRSNTLSPKDWAVKAPQYVREAKLLGVSIAPPNVNTSAVGFTIEDNSIYFGLEAISGIGRSAAMSIIRARGKGKFKGVLDFLNRVNVSRVNTKVFDALVRAGAFDRMGYPRSELIEKTQAIYDYIRDNAEYLTRESEMQLRQQEHDEKTKLITEKEELEKSIADLRRTIRLKKTPEEIRVQCELQLPALETQLSAYAEMDLKRKPILKAKEKPEFPPLDRQKRLTITLLELIEQAKYIGCYIESHPTDIIYPDVPKIANIEEASRSVIAGVVTKVKHILTRYGKPMAFIEVSDGSGIADVTCFTNVLNKLQKQSIEIEPGNIIKVFGEIEEIDPNCKVKAFDISVYSGDMKENT